MKPEIKNKHSNSDNDISAEKDSNLDIYWEYSISEESRRKGKKEKERDDGNNSEEKKK